MDNNTKLKLLQENYNDQDEFDQILAKMLEITLNQHQLKLIQYETDLLDFEKRYHLDSNIFYQKFSQGELGDNMDFFAWYGLYEMR
ncbi:MAG TPA: hypothetical protein V6C58_04240 [Allocoleopsis sp.]